MYTFTKLSLYVLKYLFKKNVFLFIYQIINLNVSMQYLLMMYHVIYDYLYINDICNDDDEDDDDDHHHHHHCKYLL